MDSTTPSAWAEEIGLARSPLFEEHEVEFGGNHAVLLDGGYGSFALSVSKELPSTADLKPADWSWSSNLPHHVTVTDRKVVVVRWDKPGRETFTKSSVEREVESFYKYLVTDRVRSNRRVVEHMLAVFRSMRSLLAESGVDDGLSVDSYLALLSRAMERSHGIIQPDDTPSDGEDVLQSLPAGRTDNLLDILESPTFGDLTTHPVLAVRHAGSDIFQEAHFELVRSHGVDLFGYAQPAESEKVTRGGAHFTPPALARSVVEQALNCMPDLAMRERLTVLDPACGSGAFLHEALRTLRRKGFDGHIRLVGRDTSRAAVSMANFVLRNAVADWSPRGECNIEVVQADSLVSPLPASDVILMNPPFISWLALSEEQRGHMADLLGHMYSGRGDYSMAFVTRALDVLSSGGVLGTLLPSSLLALNAASKWRRDVLDRATMNFIASLGDYGLFPYAQVQVAIAVLSKPSPTTPPQDAVSVLLTDNDRDATGNALRALRKAGPNRESILEAGDWRLFRTSASGLRTRPTWRLVPQKTQVALDRLRDAGYALPAGNLFRIRQGVLTGLNSVFLLRQTQLEALPQVEQRWFRSAITNETLRAGHVVSERFVFYPYQAEGLAITTEEQLIKELPEYFKRHLQPKREQLTGRRSLKDRTDWWGLSEHRAWARTAKPRIVSKFFGASGAFSSDFEGRHIVVQGYAWFPKWEMPDEASAIDGVDSIRDLLAAYVMILNSTPFQRLLGYFSPHVSGGQFDLSARYVSRVPVPNIPAILSDETSGRAVSVLAGLGRGDDLTATNWPDTADRLTAQLYGHEALEYL